jgi:hypothetical protein
MLAVSMAAMGSGCIELASEKILYLLDELCRTMGYCLPPHEKQRISETKGLDAQKLTDAVLMASGFVPAHEKQRRREIEASVSHYLARWAQP